MKTSEFCGYLETLLMENKELSVSLELSPFQKKIVNNLLSVQGNELIISPNNSTLCASPKQIRFGY